jgi:uncharacterized protein YraI
MSYTNEIKSFSCDYLNNQTTVSITIVQDTGPFKRAVDTITFSLTGKFTQLDANLQSAVDAFVQEHATALGLSA